jgi:hypothetical protein
MLVLASTAPAYGIAVPTITDLDDGFVLSDIEKISSIPGL